MQSLVKHTSRLGSKLNAWLSRPKKLTGTATKASGEVLDTLLSSSLLIQRKERGIEGMDQGQEEKDRNFGFSRTSIS